MKPLSLRLIWMVVLVLLGIVGCRSIPGPRHASPDTRDEAWVQDLTYLRDDFPKYNRSFDDASRAAFTSIVQETIDSVTSLTNNDIYVNLLRAISTPGDGHTSVNFMPSSQKLRRLPIRFFWFEEGLFVVRASVNHADLLGTRVVAIADRSPQTLLNAMRDLVPGNDSAVRYESNYYLSSPDFLEGLDVIDNPDLVEMEFETADGSRISRTLDTMPLAEEIWGYNSWRELSPLSTESMDAPEFRHVLAAGSLPAYLSDPDRSSFVRKIAGGSVLYVQVNQNYNLNSDMNETASEVQQHFASADFDAVIVDVRFNTGGNLLVTTNLVQGIPEWFSGPVYIVTGGATFSAGIVTAARLKYYAGDHAIVAGEPAAEGLQFWAETRFFTLPNSNIRFYAAHRYHNWENTEFDHDKPHFWLMRRVGVPAGDLDVDLPVQVSFADYLEGVDTVVESILEDIRR